MHEFLLFTQVAASDHRKMLQQLAGVTRMQPRPVLERHLVFKAETPAGLNSLPSTGGSKGITPAELQKTKAMLTNSLFYVQLVCHYAPTSSIYGVQTGNDTDDGVRTAQQNGSDHDSSTNWTLEFRDIPDPGKQAVTTRYLTRTKIDGGDIVSFVRDLGYTYVTQYVVEGHKFFDQDLTLFLHRPCLDTPQTGQLGGDFDSKIPNLSNIEPFDIRDGYVLQASIEAIDGNNPEIRDKATQQLMAMKETLKQAVTLAPGDRLALDTRVPARR